MVYETFLKQVEEALRERMGPEYTVTIRHVPKNNGLMLDGLCIGKKSEHIVPTIYLNAYYELFTDGMSMEAVLEDILALYRENMAPPNLDFDQLVDFNQVRDKVAYKLIHADSNRELLKSIPHLPYLDLAIVFYLFLEESDRGQMTALIHNEHLESWELTVGELCRIAHHNTPKLLPAELKSMTEVIKEIAKENLGESCPTDCLEAILAPPADASPLFVLTNRCGINGSCCILYDGILKNFAGWLKRDLLILPSSVHEVLLIPDESGISYDSLSRMVADINQTEVPQEDRLSNHIYLYTQSSDRLSIVSGGPDSSGPAESLNPA